MKHNLGLQEFLLVVFRNSPFGWQRWWFLHYCLKAFFPANHLSFTFFKNRHLLAISPFAFLTAPVCLHKDLKWHSKYQWASVIRALTKLCGTQFLAQAGQQTASSFTSDDWKKKIWRRISWYTKSGFEKCSDTSGKPMYVYTSMWNWFVVIKLHLYAREHIDETFKKPMWRLQGLSGDPKRPLCPTVGE